MATEQINDEEIIESLHSVPESDDSEPEEQHPPSAAEVVTAIDTLRRYASALDNQEVVVEAISVYECCVLPTLERMVQTKVRLLCAVLNNTVSTATKFVRNKSSVISCKQVWLTYF